MSSVEDQGLGYYMRQIMGDANFAATNLSMMLEKLGLKRGFTSIDGKFLIGDRRRG